MRNILLFSATSLLILGACGPAAENREAMHQRAKSFQDSIAFIIKSSMEEAAKPGPAQQMAPAPVQTAAATPGK